MEDESDPIMVTDARRRRTPTRRMLLAQKLKRRVLRRAERDQEIVLERGFSSRNVGDVVAFEKDLREVLARGICVPTASSAVAAHELALFLHQVSLFLP